MRCPRGESAQFTRCDRKEKRCSLPPRPDIARLVVADQLGDGRAGPAEGAVGALADLQRAEFHRKRVVGDPADPRAQDAFFARPRRL